MFHRGSRGSRRRSTPRAVIQSYKKVLNFGPGSESAGAVHNTLVVGQDSVAAGQTGVEDANVPTGSIVKYIEIQFQITNLVSVSAVCTTAIQMVLNAQTAINPKTVGGNPQRNQVMNQRQFMIGKDQNSNHVYKFKVPPKYQRVREGMKWQFSVNCDVVSGQSLLVIYKFYR